MRRFSTLAFALLVIAFTFASALAQFQSAIPTRSPVDTSYYPIVTAMIAKDQVRFAALALAKHVRLEVLSDSGEPIYDSGLCAGNMLEWPVTDTQGSSLRDGTYGALLTIEEYGGRVSHRRGVFLVRDGRAKFDEARAPALATAEDERDQFTILRTEDPAPFTLISHDEREGWIESATGGLNLYAGSLSRGRDSVPHLRLTSEGNVGIGVSEPQAKLDVAGLIRTSEGIQFPDGTIQKTAAGGGLIALGSAGYGVYGGGTLVVPSGGGVDLNLRGSSTGAVGKGMQVLTKGGGIGPVYGNEVGANTYYGDGAANPSMTGSFNSFFGYHSGNADTPATRIPFWVMVPAPAIHQVRTILSSERQLAVQTPLPATIPFLETMPACLTPPGLTTPSSGNQPDKQILREEPTPSSVMAQADPSIQLAGTRFSASLQGS